MRLLRIVFTACLCGWGNGPLGFGTSLLKDIDKLAIPPCDLDDGGVACDFLCQPCDQRLPEVGSSDGEADEARHGSRGSQPLAHFVVDLCTPENDATDFAPASVASSCHNALAILAAI